MLTEKFVKSCLNGFVYNFVTFLLPLSKPHEGLPLVTSIDYYRSYRTQEYLICSCCDVILTYSLVKFFLSSIDVFFK